jgi:hypothetical protein
MVMMLMALTFSLNTVSPVQAQAFGTPTPTPTDPSWRGFAAAREALQEEKSIDLTFVRNYSFSQVEWRQSIDNCVEATPVSDYREVYFGWDYVITDLQNRTYLVRVSFDLKAVVICDEDFVPAPAGGSTTNPNLPPPVTGGGAGGAFELGGHVDGLSEEAKTAMRQSGMTWMKKQYRYSLGADTSGVKGLLDIARANNFKLLVGVVGDPEQMGNYDQYIQTYAAFLGEVAALGVDAIEVWNEPNIDREWPRGQINGGTYTRMLAAAYNAIKAKNPNTIVISGAPAPTGFFGTAGCGDGGCNDDTFMAQMATAGAAQYMDCVGLHYNEGIVPPTQTSGDPRGEYPTYYFGSMTARGFSPFGGKPVCYTELGYLSGKDFTTPIPAGFAWANNTTVQQHAEWLAGAVTASRQSGRVRLLIIWNVNFKRWDSDPMGGYAIIRPDGTCPACTLMAQAMR